VEGIRQQYAKICRNQEAALGGLKNKAESGRETKAAKSRRGRTQKAIDDRKI